MSDLFRTILNMSFTAGAAAAAVMIARLFMKKAPRIFSYILWSVVLFRLFCPFSLESRLSLIPTGRETIPGAIVYSQSPAIESGITVLDNAVNSSIRNALPSVRPENSVNPMGVLLEIGSVFWAFGMIILLTAGAVSYFRLKYRLATAVLIRDNIYETDRVKTPFVLGTIRPRIIVPTNLSAGELEYTVRHEKTHIRRLDHIIKPLAFFGLAVHWFNPLLWLSYFLMTKDMEMSCDESILKHSGEDIREIYSRSLLSLSVKRSGLFSPLAFGETNVRSRIKNVLHYKRPDWWVTIVCAVIILALSVGFVTDRPKTAEPDSSDKMTRGDSRSPGEGEEAPTGLLPTPNYLQPTDSASQAGENKADIEKMVEDNIAVIMSSPLESSNPQDYINAHKNEYESILKTGGEDALRYMLSQFESGNAGGLRGHILMRLCKELLGDGNNPADESLSPQQWYDALSSVRQ